MTLLALLATSGSAVDPPSPDGLRTVADGELSAALRPTWGRVVRVGPTRPITTIVEGFEEARRSPWASSGFQPLSTGNNLGIPGRGGRPYHGRVLVLLDPGTYDMPSLQSIGSGIDLAGNGDSPADVTVRTVDGTRYALYFWGSIYVYNLTLHHSDGASGNNYAMHGSTVDRTTDFTAVLDNVHFYEENQNAGNIAGWDMPTGMRAYVYRCRFDSHDGNGTIVFHDMAGSDVECYFVECSSDTPMKMTLGVSGTEIGGYIRYGCTTLAGDPLPNIQSLNGEPETAYTGPVPATVPGGMTDAEASKYIPLATPGTRTGPDYGTLTTMTPASGRVYYVPVTLDEAAFVVDSVTLSTGDPGVAVGLYSSREGKPYGGLIWGNYSTSGGDATAEPSHYPLIFLERRNPLFLGVRVSTAGITVEASSTLSTAATCYYEDGVTSSTGIPHIPNVANLVPVAAGDAVPAPQVVAA